MTKHRSKDDSPKMPEHPSETETRTEVKSTEPTEKATPAPGPTEQGPTGDVRDQPSNYGTPLSYSEHTTTEEKRSLEGEGKMYNPTDRDDARTSDRKSLNTPGSPLLRQNTRDGRKEGPRGTEDVDNSDQGQEAKALPFSFAATGSEKRIREAIKNQRSGGGKRKGQKIVTSALDTLDGMVEELEMAPNQVARVTLTIGEDKKLTSEVKIEDRDLPIHLGKTFESWEEYEDWETKLRDAKPEDLVNDQINYRKQEDNTDDDLRKVNMTPSEMAVSKHRAETVRKQQEKLEKQDRSSRR